MTLSVNELCLGGPDHKVYCGLMTMVDADDAILITGPSGTIRCVNAAAPKLLGVPQEQLVGVRFRDVIRLCRSPEVSPEQTFSDIVAAGETRCWNAELKCASTKGVRFPLTVTGCAATASDGDHPAGSIRLTARRVTEDLIAVFTVNQDGCIVSCNHLLVKTLFGYSDFELLSRPITDLIVAGLPSTTNDRAAAAGKSDVSSGASVDVTFLCSFDEKLCTVQHRDGSTFPVEVTMAAFSSEKWGINGESLYSLKIRRTPASDVPCDLPNDLPASYLTSTPGTSTSHVPGVVGSEEGSSSADTPGLLASDSSAAASTASPTIGSDDAATPASGGCPVMRGGTTAASAAAAAAAAAAAVASTATTHTAAVGQPQPQRTSTEDSRSNSAGGGGDSTTTSRPLSAHLPFAQDYKPIRILGTSQQSRVVLVERLPGAPPDLPDLAAIKIVVKSQATTQDIGLVRREVHLLQSLAPHPHIVSVAKVYEDASVFCFAQTFCGGGELYSYIRSVRGGLSEAEAHRLFAQIVEAVRHCHSRGIVHRDLKHKNIMLTEERDVVLIDFGLANYAAAGGELRKTFCGTPAYAAPEMLTSTPFEGPEVDVWSLGVVLYSMVFAEFPFASLKDVISGTWTRPSGTASAELLELLDTIFEVDREKRASLDVIVTLPWMAAFDTVVGAKVFPPGVVPRTINEIQNDSRRLHEANTRRMVDKRKRPDDTLNETARCNAQTS